MLNSLSPVRFGSQSAAIPASPPQDNSTQSPEVSRNTVIATGAGFLTAVGFFPGALDSIGEESALEIWHEKNKQGLGPSESLGIADQAGIYVKNALIEGGESLLSIGSLVLGTVIIAGGVYMAVKRLLDTVIRPAETNPQTLQQELPTHN